jgi:hypothetical protein
VNWLIDDTWLDSQPATRLIPTVLGNDAEASSVGAVASALLVVIDDLDDSLGSGGYSDQQMIAHPGWPEVAARAKAALAVLS